MSTILAARDTWTLILEPVVDAAGYHRARFVLRGLPMTLQDFATLRKLRRADGRPALWVPGGFEVSEEEARMIMHGADPRQALWPSFQARVLTPGELMAA